MGCDLILEEYQFEKCVRQEDASISSSSLGLMASKVSTSSVNALQAVANDTLELG